MSPARTLCLSSLVYVLVALPAAASVLAPPIVVPDERVITASPKPVQAPVFRGAQGGGPVDWSLTEEELKQRPTEVQPLDTPAVPEAVPSKPIAPSKPATVKPAAVQPPAPPKPPSPMAPTAPVLAPPQLAPSQF